MCCCVVQLLSCVQLFMTTCNAAHHASLFSIISRSLLKLLFIDSVMPSNHLILHHLPLLPSVLQSIRVFFKQSTLCIRWPKYWSFSFSICPSHEYSGLILFRIGWFDLLAVQVTLKSLLQNHSLKALVFPWLLSSVFFMDPLSYPYMTAGKNIAWTIEIFVCKVTSLLFNTLSLP